MHFHKIQALGNDFVFWGNPSCKTMPDRKTVSHICDRHYGIGADCAVYISSSANGDYFMHVYNPDGYEAEMCGNALRCSAKYVADCGFFKKNCFVAETRSGTRSLKIENNIITAEIGKPSVLEKGELNIGGLRLHYFYVNVGNPHCVIFGEPINESQFLYLGPAIENHNLFPEGVNVEFAEYSGNNEIQMRVWERGIGETYSCITGSCAAVCAVSEIYNTNGTFKVYQPGGVIDVEVRSCNNMFIKGTCTTVFKGQLLNN